MPPPVTQCTLHTHICFRFTLTLRTEFIHIFNKSSRTGSSPLSEESISSPLCFPQLFCFPFSLLISFFPYVFLLFFLHSPSLWFPCLYLFPFLLFDFSFSVSHQSFAGTQHHYSTRQCRGGFFQYFFLLEWEQSEVPNPQYCVQRWLDTVSVKTIESEQNKNTTRKYVVRKLRERTIKHKAALKADQCFYGGCRHYSRRHYLFFETRHVYLQPFSSHVL